MKNPLEGKSIVVTRRKEQAEEVVEKLEKLGASVILFPTIEITEPSSWDDCDAALRNLNRYDGIIFTSANAVEYFFQRAKTADRFHLIDPLNIYTIGEHTKKAVHRYGFVSEEIPERASGEQLALLIAQRPVTGKKFLFPKGNLALGEVVKVLASHGAAVDDVVVYETRKPPMNDETLSALLRIKESGDLLIFFSPSSIVNFLHDISVGHLHNKNCAVIGETTAEAARRNGFNVVVTASLSTTENLIDEIQRYYVSQL